MEALTINEAASTTGWSPRMLRYIEQAGLVATARSAAGYRLYGRPTCSDCGRCVTADAV